MDHLRCKTLYENSPASIVIVHDFPTVNCAVVVLVNVIVKPVTFSDCQPQPTHEGNCQFRDDEIATLLLVGHNSKIRYKIERINLVMEGPATSSHIVNTCECKSK